MTISEALLPPREPNPILTLPGNKIVSIRTINSQFANGYLQVYVAREDGKAEEYRMHVDALLPLLQSRTFIVQHKRLYNHIISAKED